MGYQVVNGGSRENDQFEFSFAVEVYFRTLIIAFVATISSIQ
jgi:hypothetical protein